MRWSIIFVFTLGYLAVNAQYSPSVQKDTLSLDRIIISNQLTKFPTVYASHSLPIFCRIEADIYRQSKLNFALRLGSLDYVNMLESK